MSLVVIPPTLVFNEDTNTPVDPLKLNDLVNLFVDTINNLDSTNIKASTLTSDKFKSGAVLTSNITTTGEVNKVIKTDSSGNLSLTGSIKFIRQ